MSKPVLPVLASAFDASRLVAIHDLYFLRADQSGLSDANSILKFMPDDLPALVYDLCYSSALQPISLAPLAEYPPLLSFLATPDSSEFPRQALGLHILLDQVPRLIFTGVDDRWTFGFFHDLTMKLAKELSTLSLSQQPRCVTRWQELGYSFESAWLRTFTFGTVYAHSERLEDHVHGQQFMEYQCRVVAEEHYGVKDETRQSEQDDKQDVGLFPRLVSEGLHGVKGMSRAEAMLSLCRKRRAHEAIICKYGRYPYRNRALGRLDTEEEADFIRMTNNFGVSKEEVVSHEDSQVGRVRPLRGIRPASK